MTVKAHQLRRHLVQCTGSKCIVKVGKVQVKTVHCKAACAYGGAFMLGFDFLLALVGPACFPHLYGTLEPIVTVVFAKGGAFASGAAVFFDKIMEW